MCHECPQAARVVFVQTSADGSGLSRRVSVWLGILIRDNSCTRESSEAEVFGYSVKKKPPDLFLHKSLIGKSLVGKNTCQLARCGYAENICFLSHMQTAGGLRSNPKASHCWKHTIASKWTRGNSVYQECAYKSKVVFQSAQASEKYRTNLAR